MYVISCPKCFCFVLKVHTYAPLPASLSRSTHDNVIMITKGMSIALLTIPETDMAMSITFWQAACQRCAILTRKHKHQKNRWYF